MPFVHRSTSTLPGLPVCTKSMLNVRSNQLYPAPASNSINQILFSVIGCASLYPCRRYQKPYYIAFDIFSNRHISGAPLARCSVLGGWRCRRIRHTYFKSTEKTQNIPYDISFFSVCFLNYNCSYFLPS